MTIIAAITRDLGLGLGGDMLYYIKDDLRRFKALTMGHPIIMGRNTYLSLPKRPLPGRRNIVVTRQKDYQAPGAEVAGSIEAAIEMAGPDAFVLGGGQVYAQAMPLATRLLITEIDAFRPDADTRFPAIDPAVWRLAEATPWVLTDDGTPFRYATYLRR